MLNTLEIVPKQYEKIFSLPKNMFGEIYVAFIPGDQVDNIISSCKQLVNKGYSVIPHLPARNIKNEKELEYYLFQLNKLNIKKILAIGGSSLEKNPTFSSTYELFKTGIFENFDFDQINIAGHPEGNPFDKNSNENLKEKLNWLVNKNYKCNIVTQWTFDPKQANIWLEKMNKDISNISNNIEIHMGIAGPAKFTTLLRYAKVCGVSASAIIAKNKGLSLTKLLKHNPKEIIKSIVGYDNLHFFPFGGINELVEWKKI
ncbi:MAG: hypothetical protein CL714_04985 [Chloroflexi bacterium]|nr:hypothetical protein [Chloroflexota bacterium]